MLEAMLAAVSLLHFHEIGFFPRLNSLKYPVVFLYKLLYIFKLIEILTRSGSYDFKTVKIFRPGKYFKTYCK